MMTITQTYRRYGLNTALAVANTYFTDVNEVTVPQGTKQQMTKFLKNELCQSTLIDDYVNTTSSIQQLIEVVSKVNMEVKHPTCPQNLRNRFYSKKKQLLEYLLHKGLVEEILESDSHYKLTTLGHSFHQPKTYFKEGLPSKYQTLLKGWENYTPRNTATEQTFSMEDYKRACIGIALLIGHQHYSKKQQLAKERN